jgi:hypothetical protein
VHPPNTPSRPGPARDDFVIDASKRLSEGFTIKMR